MQETVIFGFTPWRHASRSATTPYGAALPLRGLLLARTYEVFPASAPGKAHRSLSTN